MTQLQKKLVEMMNLTEPDFCPSGKYDVQRITELEKQNQLLTQRLTELRQIVYASLFNGQ